MVGLGCGVVFVYRVVIHIPFSCFFSVAITCPFGEQSDLPTDDEDDRFGFFEVVTPGDTQPEDLLRGSEEEGIPVDATQSITITVTDEPESFVLMDLKYDSTVQTRVVLVNIDGDEEEAQDEPVSLDHLEICKKLNKVKLLLVV